MTALDGGAGLLAVDGLRVSSPDGPSARAVSFELAGGQAVALFGGLGASATTRALLLALLGLRAHPATVVEGRVRWAGEDLAELAPERLQALRGGEAGIVLRHPSFSLHPVRRLGAQMVEAVQAHHGVGAQAARDRAIDVLERAGVVEAHLRVSARPRELDPVQRRRAAIALGLAAGPRLLLVEEPVADLDPGGQDEIVELLEHLRERAGTALVVATGDPALAARLADRVVPVELGG